MKNSINTIPKPIFLTILDGWGAGEESDNNAIYKANTPFWDSLIDKYPSTLISTSGKHVGLPSGQMGNSEVGHMTIGSGRVILQDLELINHAIEQDTLKSNQELLILINNLRATGGACHLMGLASDGGVHSHINHIMELAYYIAKSEIEVKLHLFLDGRDTSPESGAEFVKEIENKITNNPLISIATVTGRYYAMDRDNNWERIKIAYDAIASGEGTPAALASKVIQDNYLQKKTDEFILPIIVGNYGGMKDGDAVFMANFRADRVLHILEALLLPEFKEFKRKQEINFIYALGMNVYSEKLKNHCHALFKRNKVSNTLGEVISKTGKKQLRIAETEKYAHVTYFFNAGSEDKFEGEDRIIVASPNVPTYDYKPEMSAYEVTEKVIEAIESNKYDLIVINYANPDMVGHTGDFNATIAAVEAVDKCLELLIKKVNEKDGIALITADHGNAERMFEESPDAPITSHTLNKVPLILVGSTINKNKNKLKNNGSLKDIAPTILDIMGISLPAQMSGISLLEQKKN